MVAALTAHDVALIFAYIERIFNEPDRQLSVATSISTLENVLPQLKEAGFEQTVIDESWEIPRDLITGIVDPEPVSNSGKTLTPAQLLEVFQDDSSTSANNNKDRTLTRGFFFFFAVSNYLAMFMRMVTSAQIRSDPDEYGPFLTHPDTGEKMAVQEFCETFVEVLGKEAGEHCLAVLYHTFFGGLKT